MSDYRAVNEQIEKVLGAIPNQEAEMADLRGATFFGILADAAGGRSPGSVHHRHPGTSVYFHACAPRRFEPDRLLPRCMLEMLAGLSCKIWVDDIKILGRLEEAGLLAAAHKCLCFDTEISRCGKVYSGGQVSHDWERSSGLASMRRPQTAGELMQFFAGRKLVADVSSSASRYCRAPSSAAGGAHGGNSSPDQASCAESDDRGGSMEAGADHCVEQCKGPGGQRRRFVTPEGRL